MNDKEMEEIMQMFLSFAEKGFVFALSEIIYKYNLGEKEIKLLMELKNQYKTYLMLSIKTALKTETQKTIKNIKEEEKC